MARDIAQEIYDASRAGAPDWQISALVQERADKIASMGLAGKVASNETVLQIASTFRQAVSGGGGSSAPVAAPVAPPMAGVSSAPSGVSSGFINAGVSSPTADIKGFDSNGIAGVAVSGYSPGDFSAGASSGSGGDSGIGVIVGGVFLGLVALVVLDRLMG